jgi:WXG100 family type VII secretion target
MADTGIFIKFDPERIMEVSEQLARQHKRFIQCSANIKKKSEKLTGSWQSDSATLFMGKIRDIDTQSAEMAKLLLEFSQKLASVSGIYREGEAGATREAEALPTSGVFLV